MEIKSTRNIKKKEKIHICLYGKSKTGKTSLIETLPGKTLVVNADKGLLALDGSDNVDYVDVDNFNHMIEVMQFIKSDKCKYDNVVIDSMSVVADQILKYLDDKGVKGFERWGDYGKYLQGIISTLRDSNDFNSVTIFELVEKENASGLLEKKVGVQGNLASRIGYFYDFFLASRVKHNKDESVYKIQTRTQDGFECGCRHKGLPTFIEPDLGKLFNIIKNTSNKGAK